MPLLAGVIRQTNRQYEWQTLCLFVCLFVKLIYKEKQGKENSSGFNNRK